MKGFWNKLQRFFLISKQWYDRKRGKPIIDYKKGCGYYLTTVIIGYDHRGKVEEWKMQSGKTLIVKCLDYVLCSDQRDMFRESYWQYIGYKGEKPLAEQGYFEYLKTAGL